MKGPKFAVAVLIVIVLLFCGFLWKGRSREDERSQALSGSVDTASLPGLSWIGDHLLGKERWVPPVPDLVLGAAAYQLWTVGKSGAYIRTTTIRVTAGSVRVEYVPKDSRAVPVKTDLQTNDSLKLQVMRQGGTLTLINRLASPTTVHVE